MKSLWFSNGELSPSSESNENIPLSSIIILFELPSRSRTDRLTWFWTLSLPVLVTDDPIEVVLGGIETTVLPKPLPLVEAWLGGYPTSGWEAFQPEYFIT